MKRDSDSLSCRWMARAVICAWLSVSMALVPGCGQGAPREAARRAPAEEGDTGGDMGGLESLAEDESPRAPAMLAMRMSDAKRDKAKPRAPRITTWKRSEFVPNTSRLTVGDKEELALKAMQVSARVDGFRARVVLDCFYYNERDQQLEGRFQLRLPNGASPFLFAFGATAVKAPDVPTTRPTTQPGLYFTHQQAQRIGFEPEEILANREALWSKPKEARVVPKEKAAFAYGETVRRRVDPALAEWAGAGVFNARVFPLAPRTLHRIVIGYDMDLLPLGGDVQYQLDLPGSVPECTVALSVAKLPGMDVRILPETKPTEIAGRLHYYYNKPQERTIALRLNKPGVVLLAGQDAKTGPYFATAFRPELPVAQGSGGSSHGVLMLDTSLSSNPDRFNVWLKLAKALLNENRASMKHFAVLLFNVEACWWQEKFVPNTPANVAALDTFAKTLSLEGATDLSAAFRKVAEARKWLDAAGTQARADLFLLSDGAATWGEGDAYALSTMLKTSLAGPLFAYRTGFAGTDTRRLGHLARESGGAVFSVVGEAEVARAATAHRARPWELTGVRVAGGSDLLLAGRPQTVFPGQRLVLAGRGAPSPGAAVVLELRQGNDVKTVETKLTGRLDSTLAARTYGQVAVGQLEGFGTATEEYSKAYATHFRVTGRTCSLLMLETEEDYKRFNINPEEDAFVVKGNPAGPIVAKVLREIGQSLGNAKVAFLAWLKKLERAPGIEFKVPTALRMALSAMPDESFVVTAPPLVCKLRTWKGVPGSVQEQLASRKLDYDAISAEALRRHKAIGTHDALKALSSLVENRPGDGVLARDVGFSAMEWGLGAQAVGLFRRVAVARPYEPQTYRALAGCLADMGRTDLAMVYYEVGLAGKWPGRFGEFRQIMGVDYLRFLQRVDQGELRTRVPDYARARLETVGKEFDIGRADLVVSITWNTDATDIDLHVTEPNGEECYYKNRRTKIGGSLTKDVTQGYGPEMYVLTKAPHGKFRVRVKYYASDQARVSVRTKVYATVTRGWGTKHETITRKVVALTGRKQMHDIATVLIEK